MELKSIAEGRMVSDFDSSAIPENCYPSAVNLRNGFEDGSVSSYKGNTLISNTPPTGTNKIIGTAVDTLENKKYQLLVNSNGYHRILELNTINDTSTVFVENITNTVGDVLMFDQNYPIASARVFNGVLVYTDNKTDVRYLNIQKTKDLIAGGGKLTYADTLLIKAPPIFPIKSEYITDNTVLVNNVKGDLFQFIYSYVYEDNQKSVWSVTSNIDIPDSDLSPSSSVNEDNGFAITLKTGDRSVKKIKIAFRKVYTSPNDYYEIGTFDKASLSISNNVDYTINFFNNENYTPIAFSEINNIDFDRVPEIAGCLEILNNGSLVMGDITEGWDLDVSLNLATSIVETDNPVAISTLEFLDATYYSNFLVIRARGTGKEGDVYNIKTDILKQYALNATVEFHNDTIVTWGALNTLDTFLDAIASMFMDKTSFVKEPYSLDTSYTELRITFNPSYLDPDVLSVQIIPTFQSLVKSSASSGGSSSYLTLKKGSAYKMGFVYGNDTGRRTPVVTNNSGKIKTNDYITSPGSVQSIAWEIAHQPPIWATWYAPVVTKNLTHENTYYGVSNQIIEKKDQTDVLYMFIDNLDILTDKYGLNFVDYNFVKGDRFKWLSKADTNIDYGTVYESEILEDTTYTVAEGDVRRVLKIRKPVNNTPAIFTTGVDGNKTSTEKVFFEAYQPKLSSPANEIFYHIGQVYRILNPGLSTRVHEGQTQSQTSLLPAKGIITGIDVYTRSRYIPLSTVIQDSDFRVEDFNLSDFYPSRFLNLGTPTIVDPNYRRVRRKATLVHTDPMVAQTNINGLNRVYAGYFRDYDYMNGAFRRLFNEGNYLIAIQESNTLNVPIGASIISTLDGGEQIGLSTELLNESRPFRGNFGLCNNHTAIVDTGLVKYMIDARRGKFLRLGLDGYEDMGEIGDYANAIIDKCRKYSSLSNQIILGYDVDNKEVIIHFKRVDTDNDLLTLVFSEKRNGFVTSYSWHPEWMSHTGDRFYAYKSGNTYRQNTGTINTWFGVYTQTSVDVVFNTSYEIPKVWRFLKIYADSFILPSPISTEIGCATTMNEAMFEIEATSAVDLPMTKIDGVYVAAIPMDANSEGGIVDGLPMRGKLLNIKLVFPSTSMQKLHGIYVGYKRY